MGQGSLYSFMISIVLFLYLVFDLIIERKERTENILFIKTYKLALEIE